MPGPSDAQDAVENFRAAVIQQEVKASAQVVRAYGPVYTRLQSDTRALVTIAQTRGLKPWQVMRMERLKDLERQFLANSSRFATQAGSIVTESQRAAVGLARQGALEATTAGLPRGVTMNNMANLGLGWNQLPDDAFQNFVGIAGDGAPLGNLLNPLGPEAITGVREKIGEGIALGKGPRETANLVRTAAGMPLSRALLITRTETNRAFREATRLSYQSNSQVVKGYRRHADKSERTCMACIALDGKFYPLDQALDEHPNGRCALVPDVLDYADLGLDIPREAPPQNARDWLAGQPAEAQRRVLGGTRFDAWKAGEIELNQLAVVRPNSIWGDTAVVRPIDTIATKSGRPIRQIDAPPSALGRTTPRPVAGDLVDPQTGKAVRGTRTTPPEPTLPKEWDVNAGQYGQGGDPSDYLDIAPGDATSLLKYTGPTSRESIIAQVGEQEAWARAVGGAVEVDYSGLSIKAARQVNVGIERTVVRHQMRPLDKVSTSPLEGYPFSGSAKAYQIHGNVHINAGHVGGTTRKWAESALHSHGTSVNRAQKTRQALAEVEDEIASKRAVIQGQIDERKTLIERNRASGAWDEATLAREQDTLDWDIRILGQRDKEWKQMLRENKKAVQDRGAGQWSVSTGENTRVGIESTALTDTITHEIGHYAHRRYGMNDITALDVLATKKKITQTTSFDRRPRWYGAMKPKPEATKVSEYAMTNDREFFAEVWADYLTNDGARLTPKLKSFVEEVIEANARFPEVIGGTNTQTAHLGALNRVRKLEEK